MNEQISPAPLKLYMLLLGSKAPGRHVEQHDFFFGIATELKELVPHIKKFWRGAAGNIHIDGYREVANVDGYRIRVVPKDESNIKPEERLFFINLGGYQAGKLEEQHHVILSVRKNRAQAIQDAKNTVFFKTNTTVDTNEARAHIDDKYGIDVDDIYEIAEMLSPVQKAKYRIEISPSAGLPEDEIHLGYFRLDRL